MQAMRVVGLTQAFGKVGAVFENIAFPLREKRLPSNERWSICRKSLPHSSSQSLA
jgi:hypothetical protein